MIVTRDREAGNIIENFATKKEAEKAISRYEKKDKKEGTYSPDFYEVAEIEDESFWAKKLGAKGGQAKSDKKAASSRENGKKGGRPTNKWTAARIKRALDIIDTQDKCNVVATTEKSQRMSDADFLRTYRKNLEFNTQEDFREYVEMSRTQEINFLLNRLS